MEAVYQLLDVDRGVPEVYASEFDARVLMDAFYELMIVDLYMNLSIKTLSNDQY